MWIFGYGSLIWKVGFDVVERRVGFVEGWERRFWQKSTDHRGVPDAPGRVVTLVPSATGRVFGVAYRIDAAHSRGILERLDHREKGGYERHVVTVRDADGTPFTDDAIMYVGTEGNPNWGGPLSPEDLAAIIAHAEGPSGPNDEYLLELARALREMGAHDPHVFELERLVRRRADEQEV